MKVFGYLSFWGKHFSPSRAKAETNVSFTKVNEVGEIGKTGKYKSKPYDFGAARIDFECDHESNFLVPAKILNILKLHKKTFGGLGVEEIQIFLNIAFQKQCNFELSPAFLKVVAELDIPLLMTCYEEDAS